MADFSEPLDPATPAGGAPVSGGDDAIRQFKRAIIERLGTIIQDLSSSPWKLKASAIAESGNVGSASEGLVQMISAIAGSPTNINPQGTVIPWTSSFGQIYVAQGQLVIWEIPLTLPSGAVIRRYRCLVNKGAAQIPVNMTLGVQRADGLGAQAQATIHSSSTGYHWLDSGPVNIAYTPSTAAVLIVRVGGNEDNAVAAPGSIAMVEVTYDLPAG